MEVKEKLNQIRYLTRDIEKLQELASYYEIMSHSIPGQDFTRERVNCTPSLEAPFLKWIYKKIDIEEKIKVKEKELQEIKAKCIYWISQIDNCDYQLLLLRRYVDLMNWEDVASSIHVANQTIYKYHRLALIELEGISDEL